MPALSAAGACDRWVSWGWGPLSPLVLGTAPKERCWGQGGSHCPPPPPRARGRCGRTGCWVRGKTPKSSEPGGSGRAPNPDGATMLPSAWPPRDAPAPPHHHSSPPPLQPLCFSRARARGGLAATAPPAPPSIGTSKAHLPPQPLLEGGELSPIQTGGDPISLPTLWGPAAPALSPTAQLALSRSRGLAAPQGTLPSLFSTWPLAEVVPMSPPPRGVGNGGSCQD